jgi:glyoxylase-like metal-dependent hydrolase (beta-lactamase superfamily II)
VSPIEPQHLEIALKDYTFDTTKIKTTLGWVPSRTDSQSACDTYDWYLESLKTEDQQKAIKIGMLRAEKFENLFIITTGRGIFGQYIFPVYSYLLEDLLIDTGTLRCEKPLLKFLKGKQLNIVVNTHAHEDHIGNNRIIVKRIDVKLYAHKDAINRIKKPELLHLRGYQKFAWGRPFPSNPEEIPNKISTKSYSLEVIHTPGHSPGHICLYEPTKKWLFSGDLHLAKLSLEAQPFENLLQLLESLKKLTKYDVNHIFCAHTGHIPNGNEVIQKKIAFLEEAKSHAEQLYANHVSLSKIVKEIAGKETVMNVITRGHMSKLNGVKSLLNIK